MNDLISIIVPVYNVEKYIKDCLESVLTQTYTNFEVLVIDDGSKDSSGKICDEYAKKDSRFKVIHKENEGVSATRNVALDIAKGKYITFLDSDDILLDNALEIMHSEIIETNADVSVLGWYDFKKNDILVYNCPKHTALLLDDEVLKNFLNEKSFPSVIWGKLYKRNIIDKVRFDTSLVIAEDFDFLYKVLKNAKCLSINTHKVIYKYRVRNDSAMRNKYNNKFENEVLLCEKVLEEVKKEKPNLEKDAIRRYQRANVGCIDKYFKENLNIDGVKHLEKNIKKYKMNLKVKDCIKFILLTKCRWMLRMIYKLTGKM